jgi:hypothetical protein
MVGPLVKSTLHNGLCGVIEVQLLETLEFA